MEHKHEGRGVPVNLSSPCCLGCPYCAGPGVGVCVAEPSELNPSWKCFHSVCVWGAVPPAVAGPAGGDAPACAWCPARGCAARAVFSSSDTDLCHVLESLYRVAEGILKSFLSKPGCVLSALSV